MIILKGETGHIVAAQLRKIPILSNEESYKLISEAQSGNIESLNKVIHHSLRLISFCITVHFNYALNDVDEFMELFQEGVLGLRESILRYDGRCKYHTFCIVQVWGYLRNYIKVRRDRGNKEGTIPFVSIDDVVLSQTQDFETPCYRQETLRRYCAKLNTKEQDLLTHLLKGFNQNEWAKKMGFSRQRAGQIYHKLLKKIGVKI